MLWDSQIAALSRGFSLSPLVYTTLHGGKVLGQFGVGCSGRETLPSAIWLLNKPHRVTAVFAEAIWELGSPMNTLEFRCLFLPGAAVHIAVGVCFSKVEGNPEPSSGRAWAATCPTGNS